MQSLKSCPNNLKFGKDKFTLSVERGFASLVLCHLVQSVMTTLLTEGASCLGNVDL